MAIFSTGPTVGAISGTVGGANFANTRGSKTVRRRRRSSPNKSAGHRIAQGRMQNFVAAWRGLTPDQRAAWDTYAAGRPRPNRIGVSRPISGYQEFLSYHLLKANFSDTVVPDPPVNFTPQNLTPLSAESDLLSGIQVTHSDTTPFATRQAFFYGRNLYTKTIPKVNNAWTFIGFISTITGSWILTSAWSDVLGLPIQDQVIAIRAIPSVFPTFVSEGITDMFAKTTP